MKFEHLVEINDPLNPLIDTLTREQLWRGLVLHAESPMLFVPHLDECTLGERGEPGTFTRRRRFGELVIDDRVVLTPLQQVRYEVHAQGEISASSLTVTIESPSADTLFVRFKYDDGHDAATDAANAMYDDFKRSAYQEADIDTIRIVREMAAQGRFDTSYLN
ncbi:MAG: SRPBCC family protein [Pseudomonadota bacterium]